MSLLGSNYYSEVSRRRGRRKVTIHTTISVKGGKGTFSQRKETGSRSTSFGLEDLICSFTRCFSQEDYRSVRCDRSFLNPLASPRGRKPRTKQLHCPAQAHKTQFWGQLTGYVCWRLALGVRSGRAALEMIPHELLFIHFSEPGLR